MKLILDENAPTQNIYGGLRKPEVLEYFNRASTQNKIRLYVKQKLPNSETQIR